jgi:hypothetical protein
MSSEPVRNSMSPTSEFSEVSAIFYKRGQSLLNLLLRLMNEEVDLDLVDE